MYLKIKKCGMVSIPVDGKGVGHSVQGLGWHVVGPVAQVSDSVLVGDDWSSTANNPSPLRVYDIVEVGPGRTSDQVIRRFDVVLATGKLVVAITDQDVFLCNDEGKTVERY